MSHRALDVRLAAVCSILLGGVAVALARTEPPASLSLAPEKPMPEPSARSIQTPMTGASLVFRYQQDPEAGRLHGWPDGTGL